MKSTILKVGDKEINLSTVGDQDYLSLTDMVQGLEEGDQLIKRWLSNKNTIEFLSVWEKINNPEFNLDGFTELRSEAGSNRFIMSVKKWVQTTNGIALKAKTGRYNSGTYAHKDVAFEFGMWLSPEFKFLLIKEFERLKADEANKLEAQWDVRRFIAKTNYKTHTDAVKSVIINKSVISKDKESFIYADEADLLNLAVFGCTAQQWRSANPELVLKGFNIRDLADTHQLIVLSNLESLNATLLNNGLTDKKKRFDVLQSSARRELQILSLQSNDIHLKRILSPNNENNQSEGSTKKIEK